MNSILFVVSAVSTILFFLSVLSGTKITVPFLHIWKIGFGHAYIYTPALSFQVWWWSNHFGLI